MSASARRTSRLAAALLGAGSALIVFRATAQDRPTVDSETGAVRVQIDNDLFTSRGRDRDYTGGLAVSVSGDRARDGLLSLDPALAAIDHATSDTQRNVSIHHARQLGLMTFTPGDTIASTPVTDDRPYASLIFASNSRMYVDGRDAWSTNLTLGVLGLSVASQIHSFVHDVIGSERPSGYDYQISAGGEPTARYSLARHRLWIADPSGSLEVKTTVQGSVGYLTEASAAVTMRAGRVNTSWWSFAPELTDYIAPPVPAESVNAHGGPGELYFFAGARLKVRAYNAFLQGQFRGSVVRYSWDEIEPVVGHAWIGVVTQIFGQTQLSYTLNYQSGELREGDGAQSSLWGGVQLAHAF